MDNNHGLPDKDGTFQVYDRISDNHDSKDQRY